MRYGFETQPCRLASRPCRARLIPVRGISPGDEVAGFETLLRRLLRRPCRAEQIPVPKPPNRVVFFRSGDSYEESHPAHITTSALTCTTYVFKTQALPRTKYLCAMGSQHCSVVSCGDLARRSKFPYESVLCSHHRYLTLSHPIA